MIQLPLILAVVFSNFWIWRIFQYNIFLSILEICTSILLFSLFLSKSFKSKLKYIGILIILTLVQAILIRSDINLKIEDTKPVEILQRHEREFYFDQDLGKLFLNKISLNYYHNWDLYFYKIQRNFFYVLDLNLYFFASHPRERGPYEFEKYIFLELPFFMIGFFWLLFKRKDLIWIYIFLIFIISLFIDPAFRLGPLFMFPLISCLIGIGLMRFIIFLKNEV